MINRMEMSTFCSLTAAPFLCALAGAAVIFCGNADAQAPVAIKSKGIGGVTIGADWSASVKANKLNHVGCEPSAAPFTDQFCTFEYAKPPRIAGKPIAGGAVKLRQGTVVAVGVNTVLSSNFNQESAAMMTVLRSEWRSPPSKENASAMSATAGSARTNKPTSLGPTEVVLQVRKNIELNELSITLGESQVINSGSFKGGN